jgi:hypothetical protein
MIDEDNGFRINWRNISIEEISKTLEISLHITDGIENPLGELDWEWSSRGLDSDHTANLKFIY